MSAPENHDSMDPNAPGADVFRRVRDTLSGLGFGLRERWSHGSMCEGVVTLAGQDLCRLEFSAALPPRYTLNCLPLDPASERLIVHVTGRVDNVEPMWQNDELDHFETMFRALRVRDGHLASSEFPSDYALKKWVALASTIVLPREMRPRRSSCEDVAIRPQEAPADRHPSRSPASLAVVRRARLLDQSFDRDNAIDLAIAAARQAPTHDEQGNPDDPALAWLRTSAIGMLRDRRRQMDVAWNKGSWDRALFAPAAELAAPQEPSVDDGPVPRLPGL